MFSYCKAKYFPQLGGFGVKLLVYSKCSVVVNTTGLIWPIPPHLLQKDSTIYIYIIILYFYYIIYIQWSLPVVNLGL